MKRIIYAGTEIVTGDEIARTLLRLSEALARSGWAETVTIPILNENGTRGSASVLVGPASQIVTFDTDTGFAEMLDPPAVAELRDRIRSLVSSGGEGDDSPSPRDWVDDL